MFKTIIYSFDSDEVYSALTEKYKIKQNPEDRMTLYASEEETSQYANIITDAKTHVFDCDEIFTALTDKYKIKYINRINSALRLYGRCDEEELYRYILNKKGNRCPHYLSLQSAVRSSGVSALDSYQGIICPAMEEMYSMYKISGTYRLLGAAQISEDVLI